MEQQVMNEPRDAVVSLNDPERRIGRPYAITREVEERLIRALSEGHPVTVACGVSGVGVSTYFAHAHRFPEFRQRVARARARGMEELGNTVYEAVKVEAATGNTHGLVAYYKMRLASWQVDQEAEERALAGAKEPEDVGGDGKFLSLVVKTIKRELEGGSNQRNRVSAPRPQA